MYEDLPFKFKPAPLEHIETDLLEAQTWYHGPLRKAEERLFAIDEARCDRVFLAGANPFGLKAARLLDIADLIRTYFPRCASIGCFSRITDVSSKTDDELAALASVGYDGLTIGIETGDDEALAFMNKGYEAEEIVRQCARLDQAGITYAFFCLIGVSGSGRGLTGAERTARIVNRTHPWLVGANMLTICENSELFQEIAAGNWGEETEIEKYQEAKELVSKLRIKTEFAMLGASNPVALRGKLPEQRERIIGALDAIVNDVGEERLRDYRMNLKHL